jgi:hypothetical protein
MKLQAHMKQAHGLDFFYEVVSTHNTNDLYTIKNGSLNAQLSHKG